MLKLSNTDLCHHSFWWLGFRMIYSDFYFCMILRLQLHLSKKTLRNFYVDVMLGRQTKVSIYLHCTVHNPSKSAAASASYSSFSLATPAELDGEFIPSGDRLCPIRGCSIPPQECQQHQHGARGFRLKTQLTLVWYLLVLCLKRQTDCI